MYIIAAAGVVKRASSAVVVFPERRESLSMPA
jgi:hypothetical protein